MAPHFHALQVVEIPAESFRYHVHSESDPRRIYLVDLLDHDGLSACSCKDWICRCWPKIKRGEIARCKHIDAARNHFLDHALKAVAHRQRERFRASRS